MSRRRFDPTSLDYGLTLTFAAVALIAALAAGYSGVMINSRAENAKGRVAWEETHEAAYRMYAISGVLAIPAVWYGYVGVRGLRRSNGG